MTTTYLHKVYTKAGNFVGTWQSENEPAWSQEINTPASQLTVQLARPADDYGEGVDVSFDNRVDIFEISDKTPNGALYFRGRITRYQPKYGEDEGVEITLLSYGSEFADQMIYLGDSFGQPAAEEVWTIGSLNSACGYAQTFIAPSTVRVTSISLQVKLVSTYGDFEDPVNVRLYTGSDPNDSTGYLGGGTAIKKVGDFSTVIVEFGSPIILTAGQPYYFTVDGVIVSGFNDPYYFRLIKQSRTPTPTGGKLYFNVYSPGGGGGSKGNFSPYSPFTDSATSRTYDLQYQFNAGAQLKFSSVDPSTIMKYIMQVYRANGGTVNFDDSTIEMTGTKVSYTFNTNTVLEGIQKCLELAPVNWFYYVDVATNMLHFHQKDTRTVHPIVLQKHLSELKFEKRTESIVNEIFFTGGETSPGVTLFKRFVSQQSIDTYGRKALKYTDNRVTNPDTAFILAQSQLQSYAFPEIRTDITITEDYDLSLIKVGDIVNFHGANASTGSLFDVATFDNDYFDGGLTDIEALDLQIAALKRTPSAVSISLSTIPPDVNKRIEDIKRNLEAVQTVDNPVNPT